MSVLLELAPLAAFVVAYYVGGLYAATAALMVAMAALLLVDLAATRRIPPMHGLSAALVFVFGAATLALHDRRYIELKTSVFSWLVAGAFLGSFWIGERTLVERLLKLVLAPAFKDEIRLPAREWRRMNWTWIGFYAALGLANLLVALEASERVWVNFNVFGLTLATAAFMAWQVFRVVRRLEPSHEDSLPRAG